MINIESARLCLDAADFAYLDNPISEMGAAGLALIGIYDRGGTQAFLCLASGRLYLTFRGTAQLEDWVTDIAYQKTDFKPGGRVHAGFFEAFMAVVKDIARDLKDFPGIELIVTGHSLGAALAQLAGVWFQADDGYVFGSPRVGNSDFVQAVTFPLTRFEHWTDPVTFTPPRTNIWPALYALFHFRKPTLYDRAGTPVLVDGHLHRMVHYRPSVTAYLDLQ